MVSSLRALAPRGRSQSPRARLAELQKAIAPLVEAAIIKLAVAERLERLVAIQDRWDGLREAKACFAREDYEAAMKTGVVCRRVRWIGGKDGREVVEYEINTSLIEALNSVEKRAAIETGQETDRQDINVRADLQAQADVLRKAFTLDELEAMDARIEAARNGETKQLQGPAGVPDVHPVLDKTHTQGRNGIAGRGTEPGKLPGKPECVAPTAPDPLGEGADADGVVPSVPKARPSWRD